MAYSVNTFAGGGNGGSSSTTAATSAFALAAGCSVAVAVAVKGPANIVSVTDTAGNTYAAIGTKMATPGAGTSDPAGSYVQYYIANNSVANGANVVTATLDASQTNTSLLAFEIYVDPKGTPLGLDLNSSGSGSSTGAAAPLFNTSTDNEVVLAVGWKPSDSSYMGVVTPGFSACSTVYGGYLNGQYGILTAQQSNYLVYFASTAGFVEIFTLVLQANDIGAVVADHPGGNYGAAVDVALSQDFPRSGVEIRYTTDGSTPTTGSALYTAPIHISATTRIKAKIFDTAGKLAPGPLFDQTYTFTTVTISAVSVDTVSGGDGSTLVASWTTNVPAYSFAYASDGVTTYPGTVNGQAVIGTSHEVVIAGLTPGTAYSVTVESGGVVSSPVVATTQSAPARGTVTAATVNTPVPVTTQGKGDIYHNWIDQSGVMFVGQDDTEPLLGIPSGANLRFMKFANQTDEANTAFTNVNFLTNFGIKGSSPRSDGDNGEALTHKQTGMIILNGKTFLFLSGQRYGGAQYCHWPCTLMSPDSGATWNNAFDKATFSANGNTPPERSFLWRDYTRGWVTPVTYAPDNGTLGQRLAANAFDGGNGYVYLMRCEHFLVEDTLYLGRQPRPLFEAQATEGFEWWAGGTPGTGTENADFRNNANWSKSNSAATAIVNDPGKVGGSYMCFLPGPNCYLLLTFAETQGGASDHTQWTLRVGPTPAGPWTVRATPAWTPDAFYGPVLLQRGVAANTVQNGNITLHGLTTNDFNNPGMYYPCPWTLDLTLVTTGLVVSVAGPPTLSSLSIAANGATGTLTLSETVTGNDGFVFFAGGFPLLGVVTGSGATRTVTWARTVYAGEVITAGFDSRQGTVLDTDSLPMLSRQGLVVATNSSTQNPSGCWAIKTKKGKTNHRASGTLFENDRWRIVNSPTARQVTDPALIAYSGITSANDSRLTGYPILNPQDIP